MNTFCCQIELDWVRLKVESIVDMSIRHWFESLAVPENVNKILTRVGVLFGLVKFSDGDLVSMKKCF